MSAAAYPAASPRPATWWPRLLITDFRHALVPWVIYLLGLCFGLSVDDPANGAFGFIMFVFLFSTAAIIVQVLCTDNAYGTMAMLLTFPVSRWSILLLRMLLLTALLFMPIIVAAQFAVRGTNSAGLLVIVGFVSLIQISFGSLMAIALKSRPVAWTAVMIAPFLEMMFSLMMEALFSIKADSSVHENFPWFSPFLLGVILFVVGISLVGLAWVWSSMEVRQ